MDETHVRSNLLAFGIGAVGGALLLTWATKAIPRMMSRMMQNMMSRMGEEGCNPREI